MVDIVLDSSSIINLINSGCIDKILSLEEHRYHVGDLISENEILNEVQKLVLEALVETNSINLLTSGVSLSSVMSIQEKHKIGLGESECLAICLSTGYVICTDDHKARTCSKKEIGENNVIGSMYLLREAVRNAAICCEDALNYYELMKQKGGFLPKNLSEDYFCN